MASQPAAGWKKLPLVIPVVVYNGWEPWRVATDLRVRSADAECLLEWSGRILTAESLQDILRS